MTEAVSFPGAQDDFEEETGLDFSFIYALYEGGSGMPATVNDCASWADAIGDPNFPILADNTEKIAGATPLTQMTHPEMCALSPELEIISCYSGHGSHQNCFNDIRAHAGL